MTTVPAVNSATQSSETATKSSSVGSMDYNAFLKLLIAQLKNQDPMKPTDPTQFLSQLAQFSQVTSTQNVEAKIGELNDSLRATQVLNGTTLVGRSVLARTDTANFVNGSTLNGVVDVPEGASSAQVEVRDAAGQLIRRFAIPATQGTNEFGWDGYTSTGEKAASGTYAIKITANVSGTTESLDPMLYSKVSSVTMDSSGLVVNTGVGPVPLDDVKRVM